MTSDPARPAYHFTAPAGWINDPLGVTWHRTPDGGRYELFYQFNPDAPVWTPACRWGQATSPDLVRWADPRVALEPGPGETGCWSGSVVVDGEQPVIVYTSVQAASTDLGGISLARGDRAWRRWVPDPGPVVPAPAPDAGYAHVRDPFVWRYGDRWRMAVGAGRSDRRPAVLQYSSADLRSWRPDGVVAEPGPGADGPGGTVWECPQLFPLHGAWVLVVSVWDDGPRGVACAVGDYDGRRFTARRWQRFADDPLYATTTFADAAGRRCALSWIRDVDGEGWAGALSVPWLLGRDGDRVTVAPHPDVDTLRTGVRTEPGPALLSAGAPVSVPVGRQADVVLSATGGASSGLSLGGVDLPLRAGADGGLDVRLLVDAGVVEVFSGGAVSVAGVPGDGDPVLALAGADGARFTSLTVHEMERLTG